MASKDEMIDVCGGKKPQKPIAPLTPGKGKKPAAKKPTGKPVKKSGK